MQLQGTEQAQEARAAKLENKVTKLMKQLLDVNSLMAEAQGHEMELSRQLHDAHSTNKALTGQLEKTVTDKDAEIEKLMSQLRDVNKMSVEAESRNTDVQKQLHQACSEYVVPYTQSPHS